MKIGKKTALVVILVIIIMAAGGIIWYRFAGSGIASYRLGKELEAMVNKASNGLYRLKIGKLKFNAAKMEVRLYNVNLELDDEIYKIQKKQGQAPSEVYGFYSEMISFSNITPLRFITDKSILLGTVNIYEASLTVKATDSKDKRKPADSLIHSFSLYERLKEKISKISIDTILFSSFRLQYINLQDKKADSTSLKNLSLVARDFLVDAGADTDTKRFLYTRELVVQTHNFKTNLKNDLYDLTFDTLSMVIANGTHTIIKNLRLDPRAPEKGFSRKTGSQLERFEVKVPIAILSDFRYRDFLKYGLIVADSLYLQNASIGIFKDRTMPFDGKTRLGKYPHQLLQQSGIPVDVQVCTLKNTAIVYREKSAETGQTGELEFLHTNAVISPIQNSPDAAVASPITIRADSKFMGSTELEAVFTLFPASGKGKFNVNGSFGKLSMPDLNKATIPLGNVRIETGKVERFQFRIEGDDYYSITDMYFRYQGLSISMLKTDMQGEHKKKELASLLANTFVLKSDNLKSSPHVVIRYKRDLDKSMFNLIWKGMFAGMKQLSGAKGLGKDTDRIEVLKFDN